jgi:hypothetical protein
VEPEATFNPSHDTLFSTALISHAPDVTSVTKYDLHPAIGSHHEPSRFERARFAHPEHRQSVVRAHAKADTVCEAKAR